MIDVSRIIFAQREYRSTAPIEDTAILTKHPLADELSFATLFRSESDANTFGTYILGLRKLDRWSWACYVSKEDPATATLEIGQTITIFYDRFNLDAGQNFIIKKIKTGANALFDELLLFGPEGAIGLDTTPNAFAFTDQSDVALSTVITSAPITISGINSPASVSISGGEWEKNSSGTWSSSSGTVNNGDTIRVRHTSSATNSTPTDTTLTVGGISDVFTSITVAVASDTTPNAFSFTDQNNVALSTVITSNSITISGINAASPVSVTGGEWEKNGSGTWTNSSGSVVNGDSIRVRHTSSSSNSTANNTTLTVGGVSDVFTSTTIASSNGYDVYAVLGQSNAGGRVAESSRDAFDVDHPNVHAWDRVNGVITTDITPLISQENLSRIGPGEEFGRQIAASIVSGRKVLLVPGAFGSAAMASGDFVWESDAVPGNGGLRYETAINDTLNALSAAQATSGMENSHIAGIVWVQGEQDANNGCSFATYQSAMVDVVNNTRSRLGVDDTCPFIIGTMVPEKWDPTVAGGGYIASYAQINKAHVVTMATMNNVFYARGPSGNTVDYLHYISSSNPQIQVRAQGQAWFDAWQGNIADPVISTPDTFSIEPSTQLAIALASNIPHSSGYWAITGGAHAALFELSDPVVAPILRWVGDGTGPGVGTYEVQLSLMNGARVTDVLNLTGTVSTEISPVVFFAANPNANGRVIDLHDDSTLYQDRAGTTLVTAYDGTQFVGYIVDKSGLGNHWTATSDAARMKIYTDSNGFRRLKGTGSTFYTSNPTWNSATPKITLGMVLASDAAITSQRVPWACGNHNGTPGVGGTSAMANPMRTTTAGAIELFYRNDPASGSGSSGTIASMFSSAAVRALTAQWGASGGQKRLRNAEDRPAGGDGSYWNVNQTQASLADNYTTTRDVLGGSHGLAAGWQEWIYSHYNVCVPKADPLPTASDIKGWENWLANRGFPGGAAALP